MAVQHLPFTLCNCCCCHLLLACEYFIAFVVALIVMKLNSTNNWLHQPIKLRSWRWRRSQRWRRRRAGQHLSEKHRVAPSSGREEVFRLNCKCATKLRGCGKRASVSVCVRVFVRLFGCRDATSHKFPATEARLFAINCTTDTQYNCKRNGYPLPGRRADK